MRTRDLRWIWDEEDRLLEPDPLGDLTAPAPSDVGPVATEVAVEEEPPVEDGTPPRERRRRFRRAKKPPADGPSQHGTIEGYPDLEAAEPPVASEEREEPTPSPEPHRVAVKRRRIGTWTRGARFWGLVVLALVLGTVAPQIVELSTGGNGPQEVAAPPPAQRVVMWHVRGSDGDAHLAVFAAGQKPPVVVALPGEVTINLPGQNLGTLGEAAAAGPGSVEVAVENLLGVPLDATVTTEPEELAEAVDAVGGIDVLDERLDGAGVTRYLAEPSEDAPADAVFLRWQDVLDGLLAGLGGRPDARASLPEALRAVVSPGSTNMVALPIIDIGAGLLRPDQDALERLATEHFVSASADGVRLVVLNGVGTPGIGEDVARILVPEGFRLVSSQNARSFDFRETRIVASSREDVPAAQRVYELLGVGRVSQSNQPTGLTDVTVVVGADFGGS